MQLRVSRMWNGFAQRAFGFIAASMVAAAIVSLSTFAERQVGPERLVVFQGAVLGVFALYGVRLFAQFIGLLRSKN